MTLKYVHDFISYVKKVNFMFFLLKIVNDHKNWSWLKNWSPLLTWLAVVYGHATDRNSSSVRVIFKLSSLAVRQKLSKNTIWWTVFGYSKYRIFMTGVSCSHSYQFNWPLWVWTDSLISLYCFARLTSELSRQFFEMVMNRHIWSKSLDSSLVIFLSSVMYFEIYFALLWSIIRRRASRNNGNNGCKGYNI